MRKFSLIVTLVFLVGCGGLQLKDDAATNTGAYMAGRLGYVGVNTTANAIMTTEEKEKMMSELEARYSKFLQETAGVEIIDPAVSSALYNDLVLIMAGYTDDPYMLISDLTFILQQWGAQFVNGQVVDFKPIPRSVYVSFDIGWNVSKRMKQ